MKKGETSTAVVGVMGGSVLASLQFYEMPSEEDMKKAQQQAEVRAIVAEARARYETLARLVKKSRRDALLYMAAVEIVDKATQKSRGARR